MYNLFLEFLFVCFEKAILTNIVHSKNFISIYLIKQILYFVICFKLLYFFQFFIRKYLWLSPFLQNCKLLLNMSSIKYVKCWHFLEFSYCGKENIFLNLVNFSKYFDLPLRRCCFVLDYCQGIFGKLNRKNLIALVKTGLSIAFI